jgi:hypothetical protein
MKMQATRMRRSGNMEISLVIVVGSFLWAIALAIQRLRVASGLTQVMGHDDHSRLRLVPEPLVNV